jgi:hypothetical protein
LRQRLARIAFEQGGLVVVAVLAVYVWIAPAHFADGESPHFALLGALGGAAHPSGYPSYVLWLRAWSWLPLSPAHAAGIATAVLGAAQMAVLHAACRTWGASATAASAAVAIFAAAPVAMGIYTEAEVFALNGLVCAGVLWLAAEAGPVRGAARAGLLGLLAGLGLSNHLTCVLVAPVGLLGVVRALREGRTAVGVSVAVAGLTVGLSPYLYLLVAPVHDGTWGGIDGFGSIVRFFLREDYGGPGGLAGPSEPLPPVSNLRALASTVGRTWWWALPVVGLGVLGVRSVRSGPGESRLGWAMLLASFALAGPLLVVRFNVPLDTVGLYVVNRFHLLPAELLAVPIAVAFDWAGRAIARRVPMFAARRSAVAVVGPAVFFALASSSLPRLLRTHSPAVEQEVRNVLASLPPNAVLIGENDDYASGIIYLQLGLHERTDVIYVQWPLATLPWYRARLARRGISIDATDGRVWSVHLVNDLLARGYSVFVEPSKRNLLDVFPNYLYGLVVRLAPRDAQAPTVDEVFELNKQIYAGYKLDYEPPGSDDEWATVIHERYARMWQRLAMMLDAAGKREDAEFARATARHIEPRHR